MKEEILRPLKFANPSTIVTGQKAKIRKESTKYPNQAFKQHNELKMLAKLQRNVDRELQELLPEGIEQAKRIRDQRKQQLQKQLQQPVKHYGGMLYGIQHPLKINSSEWRTVLEEDRKTEEENKPPKKKDLEYY